MANFKPSEKKLLKALKDQKLLTSIRLIREAMEMIWAVEAPRIVQDYTDHGEKHCERIAAYLEKLLSANDDKSLSDQELYLLLAGVYLHDIGMQCDINLHSEIKVTAEKLGASFKCQSQKTGSVFDS